MRFGRSAPFGEHLLGSEARLRPKRVGGEAVGGVGLDRFTHLAEVQLRPEVRLAKRAANRVVRADLPGLATFLAVRGIVPIGKRQLTSRIAKAGAMIRFAVLRLELFLKVQQREVQQREDVRLFTDD